MAKRQNSNETDEVPKAGSFGLPKDAKPSGKIRAVYFYDNEMAMFGHGRGHEFKPFRGLLAHSLLCAYGIYPVNLEPLHPRLVSRTDLGQFHADAYIEILGTAQATADKHYTWPSKQNRDPNYENMDAKVEEVLERFNLFLDKKKSPNAVFTGVYDYCRLYTTGSMGCAERLASGEANLAINWFGGMSHARSSYASSNGCYVNDTVLAILELLQQFERVMYINLTGIHCDGVEEAFYTTDRVLTISFHLKPQASSSSSSSEKDNDDDSDFPAATGDISDIGVENGEGFAINVPLEPGIDDKALENLVKSVLNKAKTVYAPNVIVAQFGGGFLATERDGMFNVTAAGLGDCMRVIRELTLPTLLLGGDGQNMADVAKTWAYVTASGLGLVETIPKVIPEGTEYRDYFGPEYQTTTPRLDIEDLNTQKSLASVRRKVLALLDKIKPKTPTNTTEK